MRLTITKLTLFSLALVVFSSCKKNLVFGDVPVNTFRPIVEFSDRDFKSVAMDLTTSEVTVDITDIRFMIRSDVQNSSTAKVVISTNAVLDYNNEHGTNYTPVNVPVFALVESNYSLSSAERQKTVRIRLKPSDVFTGENAIGLVISEANGSEVSEIADTLVVALQVKNQYDGRYKLEGAFYHPAQSPGYDPFTIEVEMHTSGPNSVKMFYPGFDAYCHPGLFGGVIDAFGAQEPEYTINTTTNAVTVQNSFPGAVTFYTMAPGFNSRYDVPNKIIYAKFGYNYAPGPVFNPATNREWNDKLTYLGPR